MTEFIPLQNSDIQSSQLNTELEKLNCRNTQSYFPMLSLLKNDNINTNNRLPNNLSILKIHTNTDIQTTEEIEEDDKYIKTIMKCDIFNNSTKTISNKDVFIKLIPILEPVQYGMGKFHNNDNEYNAYAIDTINAYNNTAYTEVFVNYLLSLCTEKNQCPNFPIFYGTCSSIIDNFKYNYSEEWDSINECIFFKKQVDDGNIVYDFNKNKFEDILELKSIKDDIDLELEKIDLDDTKEDSYIYEIEDGSTLEINNNSNNISYWCNIKNYPIQIGFFEKLEYTLEELIDKEGVTPEEWKSILFQIVYALSFIQKKYDMVHNDLHSDNIMLSKTSDDYFYYIINHTVYKVPTFGYTVKIIDFARATFKLGNIHIIPDVFQEGGDAEGQYTIPINNQWGYDDVIPNKSFDLARLSTTIYEYVDNDSELMELMVEWTKTKEGNTILFEEDSFELYCKISRECYNAVPIIQFQKKIFKSFEIKVTKENINGIKKECLFQL